MKVDDLRIADDNMEITCEIHWGRRFEDGKSSVQVYGKFKFKKSVRCLKNNRTVSPADRRKKSKLLF